MPGEVRLCKLSIAPVTCTDVYNMYNGWVYCSRMFCDVPTYLPVPGGAVKLYLTSMSSMLRAVHFLPFREIPNVL